MQLENEMAAIEVLQRAMTLHIVPRWSIVPMGREQSVAEHSYNVATIVEALCQLIGLDTVGHDTRREALILALFHDADECATGDMPTHAKHRIPGIADALGEYFGPDPADGGGNVKDGGLAKCLVSIADGMEAYTFCQRYCQSKNLEHRVTNTIRKRNAVHIRALVTVYGLPDKAVADAIHFVAQALADDRTYWMRVDDRERLKKGVEEAKEFAASIDPHQSPDTGHVPSA